MKASDWIDRVKSAKGIESDYKAAQVLGITRGGMSQIRTGESLTLKEETALKVAQALGVKPEGILLDQAAERIKDEGARTALLREAQRLFALCKDSRGSKSQSVKAQARAAMMRRVVRLAASH